MEVHIVQKGETLWKIARRFDISFDELKRVNAHLANPDYIVPGMKIFLPESSVSTEVKLKPSKAAGVVKKTEKEPVKVAPAPTPTPTPTPPIQKPMPLPAQPMPESVQPMPLPMPQSVPPMPQQMPQQAPLQMQQIQQMQFYGVPCGWMPIFDADCFPFMHPGHMQKQAPMNAPMQAPMHAPQLPVEPESPMYMQPMPLPAPMPLSVAPPIPMPDGWKLLESPEIQFEEDIKFEKFPEFHFEESTHLEVEEKLEKDVKGQVEEMFEQPESINIQPTAPRPQYEFPPQGGWEAYPAYQAYPQMNDCGCGGSYMPPPVQHRNYCNACNQPIQAMPNQMMPYPPHNNWYGTY